MRLVINNIDKRVRIFLDRSIQIDNKGIMAFGGQNDYPQIIERLVNSSQTAKSCSRIYASFLSGMAFENEMINNIVIGKDFKGYKITIQNLLNKISQSFAENNGAYILINLNIEKKVTSADLIPFKYCRFEKVDDVEYTAKIAVYENWDKDKDKKFDKNKIKSYNIYNENNLDIVNEKIKPQIYYKFFDNQFLYPLSPFDSVYLDMDTEAQIQIFKNNTIRNGFLAKIIFRCSPQSSVEEAQELKNNLRNFIGADGDNFILIEDDIEQATADVKKVGNFLVDKIETNINDKLFENWERTLSNSIRKAIKALPAVLIDYEESKLGTTSGEGIIQAVNFYNAMTLNDRKIISEMFAEIFKNSENEILAKNENWNIKPIKLI